jgi:predicted metal-dependent HD superfamily phosphohydrolase
MVSPEAELRRRWEALAEGAQWNAPAAQDVFSRLMEAYNDPSRFYHNAAHILDCLQELDAARDSCEDPSAVEAAIWFHDFVYDATRSDNEERSAEAAKKMLAGLGAEPAWVEKVRLLILDTRHAKQPATADGRLLVDIDLSIFGRSAPRFDAYERAIRREYDHVPEQAFAKARAAILRGFLNQPSIYLTNHFRRRYEPAARENLRKSAERLESISRG